MITRLKDFVKYKLNESISTGGRTLLDYFKEKGITSTKQRELTYLSCSDNDITSLKGIENCPNLTILYCSRNNLTSLEGIENLTNLTELSCYSNNLTSLEGLENCNSLTYLSCRDNDLTSLEGLENCNSLTYLSCRDNDLISLKGLENLTNLTELYCSGNNLTSLEGIENCLNLTKLYCSGNNLTSLEGIENLTKLTELNCSGNDLPFNNYNYMSVKEIKDSFYLVEHELEISSILYSITDEYDIDRHGFRYEFNDEIFTEDLLKQLKIVYKKLKMIGIITYATIGNKMHSIADLTDIYLNEYISKIHLKLK